MNRREQIQLTRAEQTEFLAHPRKAALATTGKDGFPHVVAMNYLAKDGVIYMTSYGKAQKVVNIRRNPKVAVMVETGRSYGELQGVLVRGHCQIIDDPEQVQQSLRAIGQKQGQRSGVPREAAD